MEDAWENLAYAILVGLENSAHPNFVTLAAATTGNARTEPVFAFLAGMEDIVLLKVVLEVALGMVNAEWQMTVIGSANALMVGMDLIVPH